LAAEQNQLSKERNITTQDMLKTRRLLLSRSQSYSERCCCPYIQIRHESKWDYERRRCSSEDFHIHYSPGYLIIQLHPLKGWSRNIGLCYAPYAFHEYPNSFCKLGRFTLPSSQPEDYSHPAHTYSNKTDCGSSCVQPAAHPQA